jgi:hypothetical protein
MRELIRHILKENRLQQELKQFIEDNNIFDAAEMVGGLNNLKSIFKDDLEVSEILDELTGVVDFEMYYDGKFKSDRFVVFPIKYEIIGIGKNIWGTHSWPELNLIYDDSKLTSVEKNKLITIISVIQNDNTVGKLKTKSFDFGKSTYFDVTQINGNDVDIHDYDDSFSIEDVERIHDKLYGESESLNESNNSEIDKNLRAINVLLPLVSWDGLCDIWAEYNPDDKEYEIRSKTTARHFYNDEVPKELSSLEDSIKSMGIKVYIYAPWFVDNCEGEVKFMNESSNESEKDTKKLFKITKMIMEDLILPSYNHIICSYEITLNEVFNIPEVTVLFIGGYGTKLWPMTQGIRKMYLDVLEDISKEIANYTGVVIGVRGEQTPKCEDKENIYLRESKTEDKEYSPAGKEITPKEKVYHQSNPMFRNKIEEQGLKVRAGECYKIYAGYGEKCIPAIFATNTSNKRAWFDSSYDDDVWEIDTTKTPNVKWYKDRHYESRSKHIVTFENIPRDAIKLIYEGSGKDSGLMESENKFEHNDLSKYEKLLNDMVYSVVDKELLCGIEIDSFFDSRYSEKPSLRLILKYKKNKFKPFTFHQIRTEIKKMINDFFPIVNNVYVAYDTTRCQKIDDLMESENKSENKKLELVKEMIYSFFDEVEFIEVDTNYQGKPLIKIYHDVEDTAANYDNWLQHQIRSKIQEITGDGIILSPWWAPEWDINKKLADFYIDAQKIEYDDEGNVINESDESKQERKFNKLIQNVEDYLNSNEYPSVKKFTVYYDDTHDDVIVNIFFNVEDSIRLGGGINSVIKRVGKQVMKDLEVFPLSFKYYIHFDRDINESKENEPKYLNVIKDIIEPFKYEDCVCDIRVLYNEEDDMYLIDLNMGTEELNDRFFYLVGRAHYVKTLRLQITKSIKDYLPIDNFYVGSYASQKCNKKTQDESLNESDNKEQSLQKLIDQYGLYEFIKMSGLDFNQVKSILNKMDNPKELLKQYIRQFVIEDDPNSGENSGVLIGVEIPLSNTKYVNDIMVQDSDQIAVEIFEFGQDEYGHTEQKDQYLTTINILTNEELLSMLSWMMEIIQNGYWD